MEQLQCAMLGYFGDAIRESGVSTSACDGLFSHPSEAALVDSVIPMAKDFEALSNFRDRCGAGRVRGFFANALAAGTSDILQLYETDVLALTGAQDLLRLRSRYALTFRKILLVLQTADTGQRLKLFHTFTVEPRLPLDLRTVVGERVSMALLRNVAHWCAYGEIMDAADFMVVPSDETEADGSAVQWLADRSRVPPDWPDSLLASIVIAGKERRQVLKNSNELQTPSAGQNMTEVERLRERDAAREVFDSIHDPALVDGGSIICDELARRVRKAHSRWSQTVWTTVKLTCKLFVQLDAVRDMYLCRRGDLWQAFIDIAGPGALFAEALSRGNSGAETAERAAAQRCVRDAFAGAMLGTGLADDPVYQPFSILLRDPPATTSPSPSVQSQSIDAVGAATLGNVRRLALQLRVPPGMSSVVSPNAQRRYVRLFALHIALKLAIFGLNEIRRFAGQVARSYETSPLLRRVVHTTQTLHFFLSNVAFCLQGDVQDTQYRLLIATLEAATSVEGARKAHEMFMEELYAGAFLLQDGIEVARAIDAAIMLALGLYSYIIRRESTRSIIKASAGSTTATGSLVHAESDVHRVITYTGLQIGKRILATLPSALSTDTRPAHSALWTRLNFNNWFAMASASLVESSESWPQQASSAPSRVAANLSASAAASLAARRSHRAMQSREEPGPM